MDRSGELAFEAADGFAAALAFGLFAFEVGACWWVDAALGDRDAVEGAVELEVAAAIEPVALSFAGARAGKSTHRRRSGIEPAAANPSLRSKADDTRQE